MNRSGKLKASNDDFIKQLINDHKYEIREDGSIWSIVTTTGKISKPTVWREIKPFTNSSGYFNIAYRRKKLAVHRIIYQKFIGNLSEDLVINHKDGNPKNNSPTNLELISQSDNNIHRFRTLKKKPVKGYRKVSDGQVRKIRELYENGTSLSQLAKQFKIAKSTVSYIVNYKTFFDVIDATGQ